MPGLLNACFATPMIIGYIDPGAPAAFDRFRGLWRLGQKWLCPPNLGFASQAFTCRRVRDLFHKRSFDTYHTHSTKFPDGMSLSVPVQLGLLEPLLELPRAAAKNDPHCVC